MKILKHQQATQITQEAVQKLAGYILKYGLKSLVEGVSGGIDSAILAAIMERTQAYLAKLDYHIDTHYYFLDCNSKPFDRERADALATKLGFLLEYVDLSYVYDTPLVQFARVHAQTERDFRVARGNAACRERMKFLYQAALLFKGIYPDTDDLSEEWMRFWTLKGDEGNVKLFQHFTKREMYDLGEYLGVPQIILDSAPGDGLNVTEANAASDQLGLQYESTDYIVSRFVENGFNGTNDDMENGEYVQLSSTKFRTLMAVVAGEIGTTQETVHKVLTQVLRYAFKVKAGDSAVHLLTAHDRVRFGLPEIGTPEFSSLYRELAQVR